MCRIIMIRCFKMGLGLHVIVNVFVLAIALRWKMSFSILFCMDMDDVFRLCIDDCAGDSTVVFGYL